MANPPIQNLANTRLIKFKVPQKVDATLRLRTDDPAIDQDAKNFEILLKTARQVMKNPRHRHTSKILPTLYRRWRGPLFPIKDGANKPLPQWRYLTPWMKTQIAGLVLQEGQFRLIRVHLHDDLREELGAKGKGKGIDSKIYLRDRLNRTLRPVFGKVPMFYFVEEDFDKTGTTNVRPHFHGAIQIKRVAPKVFKNGKLPVRYDRELKANGVESMEYLHGRKVVVAALWLASGNKDGRGKLHKGVDQTRNAWTGKGYNPLSNSDWISYTFKNAKSISPALPENRLVMQRGLNQESQRLWRLVTIGESAMSQWT